MSDPVTIAVVIGYFVLTFAIGVYAVKRVKTAEHYFGAHKLFGAIVTSVAAFASIMSGFGFIGGPGLVYALGATSLWITLAAPIGFGLGWFIVGKRIRLMQRFGQLRHSQTLQQPDLRARPLGDF